MTRKNKTLFTTLLTFAACMSVTACAVNTGSPNTSLPAQGSSITSNTAVTTAATTTAPMTTTTAVTTTVIPQTTAAVTTAATDKPVETTAAATTAAATTVSSTSAATVVPAPEWTETAETGTKYITVSCYSRKKAVLGAETVKLYNVNDKVTVTAKTDTGYYKLDTGAFVHCDYLSNSKVTVQQTAATTTAKKPIADTIKQPTAEEKPFNVYSQKPNVRIYGDIDCTIPCSGGLDYVNLCLTAIRTISDKGVYQVEYDHPQYSNCYVKMSEYAPTKVYIDPIFNSPLNIAAIKQYIVDYGINELGLEYHETQNKAYGYDRPGGCWFVPTDIEDGDDPAWIKKKSEEGVSATKRLLEAANDKMNSFSVWIREIRDEDIEKAAMSRDVIDGGGFKTKGVRMFEIYILYT